MNEGTSTLDVVTLVVAIAGVTLAAVSLGWQGATLFSREAV